MKFADRLKFTATGTSAATITVGSAITGFRTLAQVISDSASDALGIKVGDTGVPFVVDDGAGNEELSLFTITSTAVLTRTSVLYSSAGGTTAATFTGATLNVYNTLPASFATRTVTAVVDTLGNFVNLQDPKGNVISLIARLLANVNQPAVPSVEKFIKVNDYGIPVIANNTQLGNRFVYAEGKRKLVRFLNPATNTVSLEIGYRKADNIQNPNASYSPSIIIAPGTGTVIFFDDCEYWVRQSSATTVDAQFVGIEREVRV